MLYRSSLLSSIAWTLDIDLKADFTQLIAKEMRKNGIAPTGTRDLIYEYFNLQKRTVSQKPRMIQRSKEFCCPSGYEQALLDFEEDVRRGRDLNRYASDKLRDPSKSDALLNDWNIYHFHLTRRFRNDGTAKRSDYQLFAWITDHCFYMIQVYPHKNNEAYSRVEMLRIMENNWPDLLKLHRIPDISMIESISDQEYAELRNANVTTLVQTDENHVYGLIGGGYMSDGASGEAMRNMIFWHDRMKLCEITVQENMLSVISAIQTIRKECTAELKVRMLVLPENADEITLVELNHFIEIQLLLQERRLRVDRLENNGFLFV